MTHRWVRRLRMGTSDCGEIRKTRGGGWNRTDLSNRVLNWRSGWCMSTTAEHSFTRRIRPSRWLSWMMSPARSRNGYAANCQMIPNSVWFGS